MQLSFVCLCVIAFDVDCTTPGSPASVALDKKRQAVTALLPATRKDKRAEARKALCAALDFGDNIEVRSHDKCDKFLGKLLEWRVITQQQHDLEVPVVEPLSDAECEFVIKKCADI